MASSIPIKQYSKDSGNISSTGASKDYPLIIPVNAAVSAKYRGAFCEAKVTHREVHYLCKIQPLDGSVPTFSADERHIRLMNDHVPGGNGDHGDIIADDQLSLGSLVEVHLNVDKPPCKGRLMDFRDKSLYHVVFDDGDTRTLRRSKLLLKGTRHYKEEESLDQLPLYNPEHFKNPVRKTSEKIDDYSQQRTRQREPVSTNESKRSSPHASRGSSEGLETDDKDKMKMDYKSKSSSQKSLLQKDNNLHGNGSRPNLASSRMQRRSGDGNGINGKHGDGGGGSLQRRSSDSMNMKHSLIGQLVRLDSSGPPTSESKSISIKNKSSSKKSPSVKASTLMQPLTNIGLVVMPSAEPSISLSNNQVLVRSFKDSKYHAMDVDQMIRITRSDIVHYQAKKLMDVNPAVTEKLMWWIDCEQLPSKWESDHLLGVKASENKTKSGVDYDSDQESGDSDTSEDTPLSIEEKDHLFAQLVSFMEARNTPLNSTPTIANKDLDLCRLYQLVMRYGGYKAITANIHWPLIYNKMDLPLTSGGSSRLEQAYRKFLLPYEETIKMFGPVGTQPLDRRRSSLPSSSAIPPSPSSDNSLSGSGTRVPTNVPSSSRFVMPQASQQSSKQKRLVTDKETESLSETGSTSRQNSISGGPVIKIIKSENKSSVKPRPQLGPMFTEQDIGPISKPNFNSSFSLDSSVTSELLSPDSESCKSLSDQNLNIGMNIRVRHDKQSFLAKIIGRRAIGAQIQYRVHYCGYNSRHDDDISIDKIVEIVGEPLSELAKASRRQQGNSEASECEAEDDIGTNCDNSSVSVHSVSTTSSSKHTRKTISPRPSSSKSKGSLHAHSNEKLTANSGTQNQRLLQAPVLLSPSESLKNEGAGSICKEMDSEVDCSSESKESVTTIHKTIQLSFSKVLDQNEVIKSSDDEVYHSPPSSLHKRKNDEWDDCGGNSPKKAMIIDRQPTTEKQSDVSSMKLAEVERFSQLCSITTSPPTLKADNVADCPPTPDSKCSTICGERDDISESELIKTPPYLQRHADISFRSSNDTGPGQLTAEMSTCFSDEIPLPSPEMPQIDDSRTLERPPYIKTNTDLSLAPTLSNPMEISFSREGKPVASYRSRARLARNESIHSDSSTTDLSSSQHAEYSEGDEKLSPSPPVLKRILSRASTPDTLPMHENADVLTISSKTSPSHSLEDVSFMNVNLQDEPESTPNQTEVPYQPRGSVTRSSARKAGLLAQSLGGGSNDLMPSESTTSIPSSNASRIAQVKVPFQWPEDRPYVFPYEHLLPKEDYLQSLSTDDRIKELEKVLNGLNEAWRTEKKKIREIESSNDYKNMKRRLANQGNSSQVHPNNSTGRE